MSRNKGQLQLVSGPVVDESLIESFGGGDYHARDVVSFTQFLNSEKRKAATAKIHAPEVSIDVSKIHFKRSEPKCDIDALSPRDKINPFGQQPSKTLGILWSCVGHVGVVGLIFAYSMLSAYLGFDSLHIEELQPVEVTFGLGEQVRSQVPSQNKQGPTEADLEAQKTAQQLPQMPKTLAVEAKEKAPDTMTIPDTPVPQVKVQPKKEVEIEKTPEPGTKTVSPEEMMKRIEKENRKVADKAREGTHINPGKGAHKAVDESLPKDPFASDSVPDAPPGLSGGDPNGKLGPAAQGYSAVALNHMRHYWELPDLYKYQPGISCTVKVRVNAFGRVQKVEIVKESGDADFDAEVTAAVNRANPFPELPDDVPKVLDLKLNFRPSDIK